MEDALALITRYEIWIYTLLGVAALINLGLFWVAAQRVEVTPFGLEKAAARRRQNAALAGVFLMLALGAALFVSSRYLIPALSVPPATELPPEFQPTEVPTATPVQSSGPVVVDSSGCVKDTVMLTRPANGERIAGGYQIQGTANIENFAFYRVEISGAPTSGAWVTLSVGNEPKVNGGLGEFNTNTYPPGEYAFRLVVTDNLGNARPPCVIAVTFAQTGAPLEVTPQP